MQQEPASPDPYGDAIDWNAIWMARKKRHLAIPGYRDGEGFFQQKANVERFFRHQASQNPRVERQLARLRPPAGTSVLDIGAGAGNLAVPFAERGCRVVAVEPAAPMRDILARNAADAGVRVEVIPSAGEDLDPAPLGPRAPGALAGGPWRRVSLRTDGRLPCKRPPPDGALPDP